MKNAVIKSKVYLSLKDEINHSNLKRSTVVSILRKHKLKGQNKRNACFKHVYTNENVDFVVKISRDNTWGTVDAEEFKNHRSKYFLKYSDIWFSENSDFAVAIQPKAKLHSLDKAFDSIAPHVRGFKDLNPDNVGWFKGRPVIIDGRT